MKVVIFDDVLYREQRGYLVKGVEMVFYEDADQAVEVVLSQRPDAVLMDFSLEARRSGAEAIQALRGHAELMSLPIIAISSDRDSNERLIQAGATDAVPKTHLRGYLKRLLRRARLAHHQR